MPGRVLAAVAAAALSACAGMMPAQKVQLSSRFDAAEATRLVGPGPNQLTGNAFIRQQGGGVVTCAGRPVYLIPGTTYAAERFAAIYGPVEAGRAKRAVQFEPDDPEYIRLVRTTQCDSAGRFSFNDVASGDFFVMTEVTWTVGYTTQGGIIMRRVWLRDGSKHEVIITP